MRAPEFIVRIPIVTAALLVCGCAATIGNDRAARDPGRLAILPSPNPVNAEALRLKAKPVPRWAHTPLLSPGDRLQIDIVDGDSFNGRYEVDVDGALKLPYLPPLPVAGIDVAELEKHLSSTLVKAEYFKPDRIRVSARVHEWSHVQVHVSGEVFNPGRVTINARNAEERALKQHLANGDFPSERLLDAALRAAGGVRPGAAVDRIQLLRGGRRLELDLRGLLDGHTSPQVPLASGDVIHVPGSGRFDPDLLALSPITPPGIRVFLSNLTLPAFSNAASAAGKHATSLPYGSRLLTAAVSANCVGGIRDTNAARYVVLVRNQESPGLEQVIERPVEDLIETPWDEAINPPLQPNDSISCFDSNVTSLRDLMRTFYEILLPFSLL